MRETTIDNNCLRNAFWDGRNLAVDLICIPRNSEIFLDVEAANDQFVYCERGTCCAIITNVNGGTTLQCQVCPNTAVFVPADSRCELSTNNCPCQLFTINA